MAEIIKVYRQDVKAMDFIGKSYGEENRVNGSFGALWQEWFTKGGFGPLKPLAAPGGRPFFEDSDAYIGLMRWKEGEPFQYWLGMFVPKGSTVPAGYESVSFPAAALGVCWVKGSEGEVYMNEEKCAQRLRQEGYRVIDDGTGATWFFERYGCPRFTEADADGNVILDIVHFVE